MKLEGDGDTVGVRDAGRGGGREKWKLRYKYMYCEYIYT